MMTRVLRVVLAQIDTEVGDLAGNLDRARAAIRAGADLGAHLVVLPELTLSGYPPEDLLLRPDFLAAGRDALESLARDVTGVAAVVGVAEGDGMGPTSNAVALLAGGRIDAVYRKHCLPNYGVFDEARYFRPGDEVRVVDVAGVRVGLTICEDIWVADGPVPATVRAGAEVIVNASASPYSSGKPEVRERLFAALAREVERPLLVTNLVGGQDELVFDGTSVAFDGRGEVTHRARSFVEDLLVVDVPVEAGGADSTTLPPVPRTADATLSREAELWEALRLGTGDYVRKNGFERVVLGLSGGIDSALVAALAADALGPAQVVGVAMPSRFSSEGSVTDARTLATNLGIELREIAIGDVYDATLDALAPHFEGTAFGLAEENLQARIRGNLLMALSNKHGWLVLVTGNKSEAAVGYSTLYGDTAGGFAPIKDVMKTDVYALCRHRNRAAEVIPRAILEKPPSAELRPDQTDQDSLPPYEVLDPILRAYVEEDRSLDDIVSLGFPRETVAEVVRLVDRAEYKRRQTPPGIKITGRAFGKDRRLPITSRWRPS